MSKLLGPAAVAAAALAAGTALYRSLVTSRITLDLGVGRRTHALGPLTVDIAAPPETVFATAAAPYAERRPRALMEKIHILERTRPGLITLGRVSGNNDRPLPLRDLSPLTDTS
jgi:hypothetical protein